MLSGLHWQAAGGGGEERMWNSIRVENAPSIIRRFQFNFLLPFVCWFVKSPVSVSSDKTRSASSSESGSADVGSCSTECERARRQKKNGLNYLGELWLRLQWHSSRIDKGMIGLSNTFLAYLPTWLFMCHNGKTRADNSLRHPEVE